MHSVYYSLYLKELKKIIKLGNTKKRDETEIGLFSILYKEHTQYCIGRFCGTLNYVQSGVS